MEINYTGGSFGTLTQATAGAVIRHFFLLLAIGRFGIDDCAFGAGTERGNRYRNGDSLEKGFRKFHGAVFNEKSDDMESDLFVDWVDHCHLKKVGIRVLIFCTGILSI